MNETGKTYYFVSIAFKDEPDYSGLACRYHNDMNGYLYLENGIVIDPKTAKYNHCQCKITDNGSNAMIRRSGWQSGFEISEKKECQKEACDLDRVETLDIVSEDSAEMLELINKINRTIDNIGYPVEIIQNNRAEAIDRCNQKRGILSKEGFIKEIRSHLDQKEIKEYYKTEETHILAGFVVMYGYHCFRAELGDPTCSAALDERPFTKDLAKEMADELIRQASHMIKRNNKDMEDEEEKEI